MLTASQKEARKGRLTSSRVGILMSGDEAAILGLWREMLGQQEPEDLSGVWPVRLGEITERLNLEWYAIKHGPIARMGEVIIGDPDWMACTIDGWDAERKCPVECKHVGGWEPLETIIACYQPQIHWQMMCAKAKECALSVIMGANEPIVEYIPFHVGYAAQLFELGSAFMICVKTRTPPCAVPAVEPPVIPAAEYDMSSDDNWKLFASRWLQSHGAAQTAKLCETEIKAMVPCDAKKAFGAGIVVTRNRAGSLSLREIKQ